MDPPISPKPPSSGLGEVERGRRCRELRDVPRVSFLTVTAKDGSRRGEERSERRGEARETQGEGGGDNR